MRIKAGEKAKDLALEMGYSESGLKKLWYRYKKEGSKVYENKYANCGCKPQYGNAVRAKVAEMRDNSQGGCYVLSKLRQKYPEMDAPSERTIQRWWVKEGTNRSKGRPNDYEKKVEPNPA